MSFKEYAKEKWIKPLIDGLGIITWFAVYFFVLLWFCTSDSVAIFWGIAYPIVSLFLFLTYWDYRFWKLEKSINNGGKRNE